MTNVGSYEAKTHLPRLLGEVEAGASFTITKHGRAVARLIPVRGGTSGAEDRAADAFAALRQRVAAAGSVGIDVRSAIEEGRR